MSLRGLLAAQQQYPFAMHTPINGRAQTYENFANTGHTAAGPPQIDRPSI